MNFQKKIPDYFLNEVSMAIKTYTPAPQTHTHKHFHSAKSAKLVQLSVFPNNISKYIFIVYLSTSHHVANKKKQKKR